MTTSPTAPSEAAGPATPRAVADAYVETLADLDPLYGTSLGIRPGVADLPDFSPEGQEALAAAQRATLAELDAAEAAAGGPGALPAVERRAGRLLRERLGAVLAEHEAGEGLREVSNLFSPVQQLRSVFLLMPTETPDDWAVIGRRLANVPASLASYTAALAEGARRGLTAAPRQVTTVAGQLDTWLAADWYREFASGGPEAQRAELTAAAAKATEALAELRGFLRDEYLPKTSGTPDGVGAERYLVGARRWTGADLDLDEAYAFGWAEFHRIADEMRTVAAEVLPGETPLAAMHHLEHHGEAIEGVDAIRDWLQNLMAEAIEALDGRHVDLAPPVRRVEAMIAPPGSAAAPYYTRPSLDFSRPGRTWLPTMGATRFPLWNLVSTWYHEGVPGHHLQLAQWVHVQDRLSRYQVSVGSVSATTEGWALYAERLMDELGFLTDPGRRLGYLSAQMLRAVRVIIDIGMHTGRRIPADEAFHPGEVWTPELATEFFAANTGCDPDYTESELTRYLGMPGQAISYKLGEHAWVAGREAARAAAGADFDAKSWHMAALSLGSLGLDDLTTELATLR
ncbi:DUF885 domain-containing protein [Streptomyces millisiae]|uniref:DUF885 domain-containing protein n=1 Tax=Streptomyces millisiae TaxID=3075542 RepID=A0ABU2LTA5_9ACTN|nr:DUF885 domain-containing protein [Streptomyces sp. DSM 44918]MDT0320829.1 DUF885 domain-containing protein [Streptomyces sp. DSM 44918]